MSFNHDIKKMIKKICQINASQTHQTPHGESRYKPDKPVMERGGKRARGAANSIMVKIISATICGTIKGILPTIKEIEAELGKGKK